VFCRIQSIQRCKKVTCSHYIATQNIASAMAPDSRLLIAEMVVPIVPEGIDKTVYWMDMCMLIIGGKERSEKEFSELLVLALNAIYFT